MAGSHIKVWWQDAKGHEWKTSARDRMKTNCPYCAGKKVCIDNCLATLFPEISAEWHPINNGNLNPEDVVAKSGRKVWWLGECGHEWYTSLHCRSKGSGCPICNNSKGEKEVAKLLNRLNIKFKRQWKFKSCKNKRLLPFDFVIKSNGIKIIEYQGKQHYKIGGFGASENKLKVMFAGVQKNDKIKKDWCQSNNVLLLEIPYWKFNDIESILNEFLIK